MIIVESKFVPTHPINISMTIFRRTPLERVEHPINFFTQQVTLTYGKKAL